MLKMQNVKKTYKDFQLDVSLEIKSGTVVGLLGENGSGKTTVFKALLGLISIDEGSIYSVEDKNDVGVVFSDSMLSQYYTVKDISTILKAFYKHFDEKFFLTKAVEMKLPLKKTIKKFSTGMKAKLKVLMALSHQAKVLILDEPTTGLDISARMDIYDMLRDYMEEDESRTILISSHITNDLDTLCDEIYIINDGKINFHEDIDRINETYGLIKCSEKEWQTLDKQFISNYRKEKWGYGAITNEKQFYLENYPKMIIENINLDDILLMNIKGERL
ncbi:ABC transporter ATP-binding protein [Kandleria vitulina]|uniref:ABC transporter ATP-binding protein n=1 Tax=Kandleria vitulina TaxID=1630 RepID=UPI000D19DFBD|nr:ABC transporter ATP-binding protein [Kandleria vitulina]HBG67220.1 ABC transporter ATP-binding protein [Kandleria vitulina]